MNIGATSGCAFNTTTTGSRYNVTRGYDSASIFTDPCGYGYGNWKTVNYTNLQYPAAAGLINNGCNVPPMGLMDGDLGVFHGPVPWGTGNPAATPLFSVPGDVTLVDPLWKTCDVMSHGVWDPPIRLVEKTAMVPAATTLSQQLIATPRSPISSPYGPATVIPSVEDPKADATRVLSPISPGNADSTSPTLDSSFDSGDPTDGSRLSENFSNDDSARDAPSATIPSTPTHQSAQRIKGSASTSIAAPVVNVQSPAPGPSPGPKLSVQPNVEDTRFALSLVAPIVTSLSVTVAGAVLAANPDFISPSAATVISDQSRTNIAGSTVELDIWSQLAIGDSTHALPASMLPLVHTIADPPFSAALSGFSIPIGDTSISSESLLETLPGTVAAQESGALQISSNAIPLSVAPSKIFTIGEQVFTAKSDAIFLEGKRIARVGRGTTIKGTQVSLGSSGLVVIGSSTISILADQTLPTAFTVGSEVITPNPTAISMDGTTITAGGSGVAIAGTQVSLGSSGLLVVGSSTISLSADQTLPTVLPTEFTVGSEVFTANPTAISMDGTVITVGGPGITMAGTQVSLGSSGLVVIGSSTISLLADPALPTAFTVGSEVITPNPTAISMDGTTITAGGSGITIAGTPVDLQASGTLVIGNSTFAVIPTNVSTSATNLIFEGQALRRRRNIFFGGVYVITICIALVAL